MTCCATVSQMCVDRGDQIVLGRREYRRGCLELRGADNPRETARAQHGGACLGG